MSLLPYAVLSFLLLLTCYGALQARRGNAKRWTVCLTVVGALLAIGLGVAVTLHHLPGAESQRAEQQSLDALQSQADAVGRVAGEYVAAHQRGKRVLLVRLARDPLGPAKAEAFGAGAADRVTIVGEEGIGRRHAAAATGQLPRGRAVFTDADVRAFVTRHRCDVVVSFAGPPRNQTDGKTRASDSGAPARLAAVAPDWPALVVVVPEGATLDFDAIRSGRITAAVVLRPDQLTGSAHFRSADNHREAFYGRYLLVDTRNVELISKLGALVE